MKKLKTNIKRGSDVVVITGSHKGKRGKILNVLLQKGRVVVENVAFKKKHQKASQNQPEGGLVEREGSIHISNVMLSETYDKKKSNK